MLTFSNRLNYFTCPYKYEKQCKQAVVHFPLSMFAQIQSNKQPNVNAFYVSVEGRHHCICNDNST